jgi:hypothetical protein
MHNCADNWALCLEKKGQANARREQACAGGNMQWDAERSTEEKVSGPCEPFSCPVLKDNVWGDQAWLPSLKAA